MTYFEIITAICDITIAAAGLFFVIKEAIEVKRQKNKENKEKETCLKLAQEATSISELICSIKTAKRKLEANISYSSNVDTKYTNEMTQELSDAISVAHIDCEKIHQECIKLVGKIRGIYENLLKNERMFSLSIGFERVIVACRPIVYNMESMIANLNNCYMAVHQITKKIGFYQAGNYNYDDIHDLCLVLKKMSNTLDEICILLEKVHPLVRELEIKFSEDDNIK